MIFIWRKKINEIVCVGLNKRVMGYMVYNKIKLVYGIKYRIFG